jgi:hypothetical protein
MTLQKDPMFMMGAKKPGSEQEKQLQDLRDAIKSHTEERTLYQGLLAGSQSGTSAGTPASAPGYQSEAGMKSMVAGDIGANPEAIQREIAATQESLKNVTDPKSREQLKTYLDGLTSQASNQNLQRQKQSSQSASGKPNYSNLWK